MDSREVSLESPDSTQDACLGSGIPIPLIPTLGNNDVVPDYSVQVSLLSPPFPLFHLVGPWMNGLAYVPKATKLEK